MTPTTRGNQTARSIQMPAQLKDEIGQHDMNAYIAAKNFLRGLEVEASQTPRHAGIAAN